MAIDLAPAPAPASLGALWDPEAVTVVGASADTSKWGWFLARGALRGAHRRPVHLVNRRGAEIAGVPSVRTLPDVPGPLGLVALCVPAAHVPSVVGEALRLGATGFVGITAGIDHAVGRVGAEQELAERIRAAGARLVGPNCLGVVDVSSELHLAWGDFVPGHLAVVSQSGQLGPEIAGLAARRGMGISRFVSVGNQADVSAAEALASVADHEATRVAVLYAESFGYGTAVVEAITRLRAAGKPTVVLTVGASGASRAAAASHTGSMTSATDVVDAACRAAGAARVSTPTEAVDLAMLLSQPLRPAGRRVALVADSGGQGAIAADVATASGLEVAPFGEERRALVADLLPVDAGVTNPVDLAGAGEQDLVTYARVVETCLADDDMDSVVLSGYFGSYAVDTPTQADAERTVVEEVAAAARRYGKPVVLHSMCHRSPTTVRATELGLPVYQSIEAALGALASASELGRYARTLPPARVLGEPALAGGYLAARQLLERVGISFPAARRVHNGEEVRAATQEVPAPWVLKADWIEHKTEHAAVAIGIDGVEDAETAFEEMHSRLGDGAYVLEAMDERRDVVELIVGLRHDPGFGPVVMVGAGGVQSELWADTVVELAPVSTGTARSMLERLVSHRLLTGWRGRPAVDLEAVAHAVAALSELGAVQGISEIEVNPLRCAPGGVLAVDALVIRKKDQQ